MNDSPHPHCSSAAPLAADFTETHRKDVGKLTDVRIAEHKPLAQLVFYPIHLATNDAEECFAINQHFDSVLLHGFVEFSRFVHVFEMICQS